MTYSDKYFNLKTISLTKYPSWWKTPAILALTGFHDVISNCVHENCLSDRSIAFGFTSNLNDLYELKFNSSCFVDLVKKLEVRISASWEH